MERQITEMKITQLSPNIGADIDGIDLAKPLTREVIETSKSHGINIWSYASETSRSMMMTYSGSANIFGNLIRLPKSLRGYLFTGISRN